MSTKKVRAGLVLCLFVLSGGIVFYLMNHSRPPAPVPLIQGQDPSRASSETFAGLSIPENIFCDRILVQKNSRAMTLYRGTEALKTYRIALGGNPLGPKEIEGDQKTPEGIYQISGRNPKSDYHLSLRVSYPGPDDLAHAASLGKSPGGDIMIHGLPNDFIGPAETYQLVDWTAGCIAVNNTEIEEIWRVVQNGTTLEIRP